MLLELSSGENQWLPGLAERSEVAPDLTGQQALETTDDLSLCGPRPSCVRRRPGSLGGTAARRSRLGSAVGLAVAAAVQPGAGSSCRTRPGSARSRRVGRTLV